LIYTQNGICEEFMLKVTALTLVAFLIGCATHSTLTVTSQPSGASITEAGTGKALGVAPVVLYYDAHKDASGCFQVGGLNAKWVSGATTSSEPIIRFCGSNTGIYRYLFIRDAKAEGLDKDFDFSMRQGAVAAQQAQAKAANSQAQVPPSIASPIPIPIPSPPPNVVRPPPIPSPIPSPIPIPIPSPPPNVIRPLPIAPPNICCLATTGCC
jgi:outer membrane biosynthesis protein TonB